MPYKSRKIKIEGTRYDARRKVTPEMREAILEDKDKLSQRKAARKYGVSRSTIRWIWMPEKHERNKRLAKERRKDGRYYDADKHREYMRKHRKRKQNLYKKGEIKLNKQNK
jgi:hypothetical protein